ncbi:MAG: ATP-binding cassette domain-containing protein [Myxococcota bacterium]
MERTAEPPRGYRAVDFEPGREASILARALELAAQEAGAPIRAEDAWRASSNSTVGSDGWLRAAGSASNALGLHPEICEQAPTPGPRQRPALVRTGPGQWLIALGGHPKRSQVVRLDERGEARMTMTAAQLHAAAGDQPWVYLQPLLALDPISAQRRPELAAAPWRRLRAFLRLERRDLWVVLVYAIVIGGLTLATPIAVQALVNTVAFGSVLQPLVVLSLLLLGGLAFSGLLSVLETYVVEVLQRRVFIRVADDFGRRLPSVRAEVFDEKDGSEVVNRFFDVLTIQKSLSVLLLDGMALTLQTFMGMLLLGFYHPLLLTFDVVLIVLLLGVLIMGRGAVSAGLRESSAKYRTAAWLEGLGRAPHLFRGMAAQKRAAEHSDMLSRDYIAARKGHFRILLRQLAGGIGLQVLAVVSLLGVGGWLVINRQLTLGQLVAAELVIAAMGVGFMKLGNNLEKLYDLDVAVLKISEVVDLPTERRGGEPLPSGSAASVAVREVDVRRGERGLLHGAALELPAGQSLRLMGDAGSGKSTLLEVLGGFRRPSGGSVHIDGLDLRRADLASVRDRVLMVRGADFIVGTVIDNLRLAADTPLDEPAARALLRLVDIEDAVDRLPSGLDTPLLPLGGPLSDTQARRLALVRALAARPRVLLLDRALDGLGLSTEAMDSLLDTVLADDAGWTTIVVTEDPRVAERCDRSARISDGALEVVQ